LIRGREYFFAEDFTRVTGLICQVRRGNATFFFFDFIFRLNHFPFLQATKVLTKLKSQKSAMYQLVGRASSRAGVHLIVRLARTLAPPIANKLTR
jgi:hypothetical protein